MDTALHAGAERAAREAVAADDVGIESSGAITLPEDPPDGAGIDRLAGDDRIGLQSLVAV